MNMNINIDELIKTCENSKENIALLEKKGGIEFEKTFRAGWEDAFASMIKSLKKRKTENND